MKKIIYLSLAVALAMFAGCQKETTDEGTPGTLELSLSCDGEFTLKSTEPAADLSRFNITITRPAHGWTKTFVYGQMPEILELTPGVYTIKAESPDKAPARFDQPIFSGSSEFEIIAGEVTSTSVLCSIENMKVTLQPTDNFNKELSNYTVVISNGFGSLEWTKEDIATGKAGYFTVAPLSIHVDGYRAIDDATPATFDGRIEQVASKDHHIIRLDAKSTGAVNSLQLSVDYTTNNRFDNIEVPGFDETPVPGGDPEPQPETPTLDGLELIWAANPDFQEYELKSAYNEGDVTLEVKTKNFLSGFTVNIKSETAAFSTELGNIAGAMPQSDGSVTLDLMNPDTAASLTFLPTGDALLNKSDINFPLTDLLPMICIFSPEIGSRHIFTMTVTDTKGQVLKKGLTFVYKGN